MDVLSNWFRRRSADASYKRGLEFGLTILSRDRMRHHQLSTDPHFRRGFDDALARVSLVLEATEAELEVYQGVRDGQDF